MRIGLFSGSFDPIHCGHAMMVNYVSQYAGLDEVWLMPSPLNPLKSETPPVSFAHRLEMCRIVAGKCERVKVSDFEDSLPSPSYTYDTLSALKEARPEDEFRLVIGSDNWHKFGLWRNADGIVSEFGLLVYPRPGFEVEGNLPENVILLKDAPVAVLSSTFVREAISQRRNLTYFLDEEVIDYIKKNKLYERQ